MSESARSYFRAAITIACAAALYEALARSGWFAPALMPTLPQVGSALTASLADGTMLRHTISTLYRVLFGLSLAIVAGLPIGILMGRFRAVENFVLPLASALMPIPSLAWVPVFILWFGLGNATAIGIVFYAALFPMLLNAWSGVRAVNPLWLRAGSAMGADEHDGEHPPIERTFPEMTGRTGSRSHQRIRCHYSRCNVEQLEAGQSAWR
jgi:ABC-type nitrate/sulfonate/bicarbonate transport system permease component